MVFAIISIFPELLVSPLAEGIINRARQRGQIDIRLVNLRDFADGPHAVTDDRPFGGGEGMVMKPEPLTAAVEAQKRAWPKAPVILLTPQGRLYNQKIATELARHEQLVLVCGRYEGVDERFRAASVDDEISVGDYILSGGELAAMLVVDSVTRLLPGVLGCAGSAENDTFSRNLLKHPHYTRPRLFRDQEVPAELLSGNHRQIAEYRFLASVTRTLERRPDLLAREVFSAAEMTLLRRNHLYRQVLAVQREEKRAD